MKPEAEQLRATGEPEILCVPAWKSLPWLRAGFSTRLVGGSQVYGPNEQNLGWTVDDDEAIVRGNRARFVQTLASGLPAELVTVRQVHSAAVRSLEQQPRPWVSAEGKACLQGDGLVTATPGRLLAVLTADCVPVLLADTRTRAVGAIHAGWRGTLAGIVACGVEQMQQSFGTHAGDLVAAIGPCIRACCFEVGDEVRSRFAGSFAYGGELFHTHAEGQRLHLDLVEANRRQLLDAGVAPENISVVGGCTACATTAEGRRQFFSYRAEAGRTGRMLSGIVATA